MLLNYAWLLCLFPCLTYEKAREKKKVVLYCLKFPIEIRQTRTFLICKEKNPNPQKLWISTTLSVTIYIHLLKTIISTVYIYICRRLAFSLGLGGRKKTRGTWKVKANGSEWTPHPVQTVYSLTLHRLNTLLPAIPLYLHSFMKHLPRKSSLLTTSSANL